MGTEVPTGFLWLQGSSSLGIDLKRPVRNAHRWRLEICFINVDRLTSCLLTFARPVETSAPPPKHTKNDMKICLGGGVATGLQPYQLDT